MVTPKETIAPTGPTQFRPQDDLGGTWLPPKVQVPGTREPPSPMTAQADAQQRHRSGANQLEAARKCNGLGFPIMQQACLLPRPCLERRGRIELSHVQPGRPVNMPGSFIALHFEIDSAGNMDIACG